MPKLKKTMIGQIW